jgi:uncharacterized pyridoxal phosphate-containing UPF0001 family protein
MSWIYGLVVQSVRIFGLFFRRLRELTLRLSRQPISAISLKELSMGMSNDYHVAVEEGAAMVRVGTAIVGALGD